MSLPIFGHPESLDLSAKERDRKLRRSFHFDIRFTKRWLFFWLLALPLAFWIGKREMERLWFSGYPLHSAIKLVSHFGELRPDHFHMGLDISTNGKENDPVFAIKDGYVIRARIEEGGTGKCLFIQHNDGTVSVYGHLNHFFKALEQILHEKQYKEKKWQQDTLFMQPVFKIKKGEQIGLSGNTGHSEAPHLHFEIRNSKTHASLYPADLKVQDKIPPQIKAVYWYDRTKSIYETSRHLIDRPASTSKQKPLIVNVPRIGLGIAVQDLIDNRHLSEGATSAKVSIDGNDVFSFSLDSLLDIDARYVNACIDYPYWIHTGNYIQLLFCLPGNHFSAYQGKEGNIKLSDHNVHHITILIGDASGNTSSTSLYVQFKPVFKYEALGSGSRLLPKRINEVKRKGLWVTFPSTAFYDTVRLTVKPLYKASYSEPELVVGNEAIPVQDSFRIALYSNAARNKFQKSRALVQVQNERVKKRYNGAWRGSWLETKSLELGTYSIVIDTIPPTINTVGWQNNQLFEKEGSQLRIKCSDESGLKDLRAELDGQWILMSKKDDLYTYSFDEMAGVGNHRLRVRATDLAGNVSTRVFHFSIE